MNKLRPVINHKVIEIFNLDSKILLDCESIIPKINLFVKEIGLKVVAEKYHNFKPYGATMIFVLSESHLAVHTWYENNYLHLDLVTCGKVLPKNKIVRVIKDIFKIKSNQINVREIEYGN